MCYNQKADLKEVKRNLKRVDAAIAKDTQLHNLLHKKIRAAMKAANESDEGQLESLDDQVKDQQRQVADLEDQHKEVRDAAV